MSWWRRRARLTMRTPTPPSAWDQRAASSVACRVRILSTIPTSVDTAAEHRELEGGHMSRRELLGETRASTQLSGPRGRTPVLLTKRSARPPPARYPAPRLARSPLNYPPAPPCPAAPPPPPCPDADPAPPGWKFPTPYSFETQRPAGSKPLVSPGNGALPSGSGRLAMPWTRLAAGTDQSDQSPHAL